MARYAEDSARTYTGVESFGQRRKERCPDSGTSLKRAQLGKLKSMTRSDVDRSLLPCSCL
jgi:hypothetical protein